jgi:hypothetical protein
VYHTVAFGFMNARCIDYIEGRTDPIDYYNFLDKPMLRKQKDTINSLVKGWFTNRILKLVDYLLIGLGVSAAASIATVILVFMLGSNMGYW